MPSNDGHEYVATAGPAAQVLESLRRDEVIAEARRIAETCCESLTLATVVAIDGVVILRHRHDAVGLTLLPGQAKELAELLWRKAEEVKA